MYFFIYYNNMLLQPIAIYIGYSNILCNEMEGVDVKIDMYLFDNGPP
jgi:hypothetical protein